MSRTKSRSAAIGVLRLCSVTIVETRRQRRTGKEISAQVSLWWGDENRFEKPRTHPAPHSVVGKQSVSGHENQDKEVWIIQRHHSHLSFDHIHLHRVVTLISNKITCLNFVTNAFVNVIKVLSTDSDCRFEEIIVRDSIITFSPVSI